MNINTTQVDMYGLSMFMRVQGKSTIVDQPAILNSGFFVSPQVVLKGYQSFGTPWTGLVVSNDTGPLRIIAPYHGIANMVFPSNELDSYIAQVWSFYASGSGNSITYTHQCAASPQTFSGSVLNNNLVFSEGGTPKIPVPAADDFAGVPKFARGEPAGERSLRVSSRRSGGANRGLVDPDHLTCEQRARGSRWQCVRQEWVLRHSSDFSDTQRLSTLTA